jgi:hypothetical protein
MHVYGCWIPCYDPSADVLFCLYSVLVLMSWKVYIDRERESEELVSTPVNPGLLCAGLFVQRRNITMGQSDPIDFSRVAPLRSNSAS